MSNPKMLRRRDYTGQQFGYLTAVRFSQIKNKQTFWLFRCKCGNELECRIDQVKSKNTQSCGCIRSDVSRGITPTRFGHIYTPCVTSGHGADLTGQVFGRLTVTGEAPKRNGKKARRWLCQCVCGNKVDVSQNSLTHGRSRSCGCYMRERSKEQAIRIGAANKTHGMTDTPEYVAWRGMMDRCSNPNCPSYENYGGRGIKVCPEWSESFEAFFVDMGEKPSPQHSLGRIDTNGDYAPENCRWETHLQQQRNRRNNRPITVDGDTLLLSEWAELMGVSMCVIHLRLKYGWPPKLAVFTPKGVYPEGLESCRGEVSPLLRMKADARSRLNVAVKSGKIAKPSHCQHEGCQCPDVQAHHHKGYAREVALDVVWLCHKHHEDAEKLMPPELLRE